MNKSPCGNPKAVVAEPTAAPFRGGMPVNLPCLHELRNAQSQKPPGRAVTHTNVQLELDK